MQNFVTCKIQNHTYMWYESKAGVFGGKERLVRGRRGMWEGGGCVLMNKVYWYTHKNITRSQQRVVSIRIWIYDCVVCVFFVPNMK